jgi:hypothetical protein
MLGVSAPCLAYLYEVRDLLNTNVTRGVAGFLWLGVQTIEAPYRRREFDSRKYPIGTPDKFSHRICKNLRGPPDRRCMGGPDPGPPASYAAERH